MLEKCKVLTFVVVFFLARAQAQQTPGGKSFSFATKGGSFAKGEEHLLYETQDGPGFFTEMWFAGKDFDNPSTVISIFIDGESEPSIEFNLYLGHGIGCNGTEESGHIPWHTRHFGHEAQNGGLFNTYRIPFSSGAVIKTTSYIGGVYWFIVRGLLNTPLFVGGFQLPNNTRLRLYKQENQVLQPYDFLTLANIEGKSGWLYQVTLDANSSTHNYLQGCFRAKIDKDNVTFLSSGTEDMFMSAYDFDGGTYMADDSGLTCKDGSSNRIGAYKFFASNPVLFTRSLSLFWRCGENKNTSSTYGGNCFSRDSTGPVIYQPLVTMATTYAWVYEY